MSVWNLARLLAVVLAGLLALVAPAQAAAPVVITYLVSDGQVPGVNQALKTIVAERPEQDGHRQNTPVRLLTVSIAILHFGQLYTPAPHRLPVFYTNRYRLPFFQYSTIGGHGTRLR